MYVVVEIRKDGNLLSTKLSISGLWHVFFLWPDGIDMTLEKSVERPYSILRYIEIISRWKKEDFD